MEKKYIEEEYDIIVVGAGHAAVKPPLQHLDSVLKPSCSLSAWTALPDAMQPKCRWKLQRTSGT